jgi:hypothetical protein
MSKPSGCRVFLSLVFLLAMSCALTAEASARSSIVIVAKPMQPVTLARPTAPTPPGPDSVDAEGSTEVASGAGVHDRTPAEYASTWGWGLIAGCQGSDHWFWWLFKTDGTVKNSGERFAGCSFAELYRPGGNTYYWKELNHTGDHPFSYQPHALTWLVCWTMAQYC